MGAATTSGEADTGTLRVWDDEAGSAVVGTSGQSAWVEHPSWGEGQSAFEEIDELQRDPAAAWTFSTAGTDAVDVATFTVDVRYLAVAD